MLFLFTIKLLTQDRFHPETVVGVGRAEGDLCVCVGGGVMMLMLMI